MIRFLYTCLLTIIAPVLLFGLYKKKPGKPSVGSRWKEHFGCTPQLSSSSSPIWIHAVSVGETLAVKPLIAQLKKHYPNEHILITTTTATGAQQAKEFDTLAEHRYMPLDYSFAVQRFINIVHPKQLLIMETELWPNTIHTVAKNGIPITVINARLSEKSYKQYRKIMPLFAQMLPFFDQVLCQSQSDATYFEQLGIPKGRLSVTGSIKSDIRIPPEISDKGQQLRNKLGQSRPVWIAVSTHSGEDEKVLNAHKLILEFYPNALLIVVPRHPERFDSVFTLCQQHFKTVRRTQPDARSFPHYQVYLADTMGEMLTMIQSADICFMGGSLAGSKVGGHNVLEPAALEKSIITGPSYYNFKDIVESLHAREAITIVKSEKELADSVINLFSEPIISKSMSQKAKRFVNESAGSIDKTLEYIFSVRKQDRE